MSTRSAIVLVDKRKEGKGTSCSAYMKLLPSKPADAMALQNRTDLGNILGAGNTF